MFRWKSPDICVYDWSGYKGSLLENVVPAARRLRAKFEERPARLASRLHRNTRLLIVHLDISDNAPFIIDPAALCRVLADRGVEVLNNRLPDIRKRTVQACCKAYGLPSVAALQDGDADELLIVKTDLNSGGSREQQLSAHLKSRFNLPTGDRRIKAPSEYYVKRRGDILAEVWCDPDLVVERYMANAWGRFYRVYVAGNAVVISEAYNQEAIKRMGGDIRRYNHRLWRQGGQLHGLSGDRPTLSSALLNTVGIFASRFQLDFGAIDIVENQNDEFHIVDVNKTPYWGDEVQSGLLEHLSEGFAETNLRAHDTKKTACS